MHLIIYSLAKQINHRPIPKLIAVGLAAAAALAVLLFLAWPVAAQGQLSLSDFDREGLEVEALALFIAGDAGSEPALYNVSSRWDASGGFRLLLGFGVPMATWAIPQKQTEPVTGTHLPRPPVKTGTEHQDLTRRPTRRPIMVFASNTASHSSSRGT